MPHPDHSVGVGMFPEGLGTMSSCNSEEAQRCIVMGLHCGLVTLVRWMAQSVSDMYIVSVQLSVI